MCVSESLTSGKKPDRAKYSSMCVHICSVCVSESLTSGKTPDIAIYTSMCVHICSVCVSESLTSGEKPDIAIIVFYVCGHMLCVRFRKPDIREKA